VNKFISYRFDINETDPCRFIRQVNQFISYRFDINETDPCRFIRQVNQFIAMTSEQLKTFSPAG
jgi:predicted methyltransferase